MGLDLEDGAELVVRPEGLEPAAYWFEAIALPEINKLQACPRLLIHAYFQRLKGGRK
jgi:hypothetical protein